MTWLRVPEIKSIIGKTGGDDDVRLARFADAAVGIIEGYTERSFGKATTETKRFDGGCKSIILSGAVQSVISITDSLYNQQVNDFLIDEQTGIVRYDRYSECNWPDGFRRWEVTYIVSDEIPHDIILAGALIAGKMFDDNSFMSERDGDYSYTRNSQAYEDGFLTSEIKQLLRPHRRRLIIA